MQVLAIKKIIIASRFGRFFDSKLRLILSFIPFVHSIMSIEKVIKKPDSFVFFLYGGIGDVVLTLPLINKLSSICKVTIFCDSTVLNLTFLFPENAKVVVYKKNTLLSDCSELRNQIKGLNPVFVQTSPIFEVYILRALLRIPYAIGLTTSFNSIRTLGFRSEPLHIASLSRLATYETIFTAIVDRFSFHNFFSDNNSKAKNLALENFFLNNNNKYIVISTTKSAQWDMGKMADYEYMKLAEYIVKNHKFKVLFVGHKSERDDIDHMLAGSLGNHMIENVAGDTSLEELASIMKKAEFVIANDNGVSHMSSYLGLKTLVLFMFSDPSVYTWNNDNYSYIFNKKHDCMPCVGLNRYPQDNYPVFCKNQLVCNETINSSYIIKKLETLHWL